MLVFFLPALKTHFWRAIVNIREVIMCKSYGKAQGLIEYSLILVFVAMAVIVVLALFGPGLGAVFSNIIAAI
jgi:hypothetical protein